MACLALAAILISSSNLSSVIVALNSPQFLMCSFSIRSMFQTPPKNLQQRDHHREDELGEPRVNENK